MLDLLEAWHRLASAAGRTVSLLAAAAAGASAERASASSEASVKASAELRGAAGGGGAKGERKLAERRRAALATVRAMALEGSGDPGDNAEPEGTGARAGAGPYTALSAMLAERRGKLAGWIEREQAKHWQRTPDKADRPHPVPFPSLAVGGGGGGSDDGGSEKAHAWLSTADLLAQCDADAAGVERSRRLFLGLDAGVDLSGGSAGGGSVASSTGGPLGAATADAPVTPAAKRPRSELGAAPAAPAPRVGAGAAGAAGAAVAAGLFVAAPSVGRQVGQHPFATEYGDHFETPREAYAHLAPALAFLAARLGKTPASLRIYDPFFCAGKLTFIITINNIYVCILKAVRRAPHTLLEHCLQPTPRPNRAERPWRALFVVPRGVNLDVDLPGALPSAQRARGRRHGRSPFQPPPPCALVSRPCALVSRRCLPLPRAPGAVVRHLASLGFTSVVHENVDFWGNVRAGTVPSYDLLLTNPPFSGDHKATNHPTCACSIQRWDSSHVMPFLLFVCFEATVVVRDVRQERILDFCAQSRKPWMLLLPNYVATKSYYAAAAAAAHPGSFFVVPPSAPGGGAGSGSGRYAFEHPEGTGHSSSPFESFWFVNLARAGGASACAGVAAAMAASAPAAAARAVATVDELRQRGLVPTAKRGNPKQRRKKDRRG